MSIYLALTRPDVSYAVNRLSQFMHRPTVDHWNAVKRVLRYLSGTLSHGIFLTKQTRPLLHAFSDADWAGDTDDYVSTNGFIVYLGTKPLSWTSKKQKGVARSSTEVEYRAVPNTAAELRWICSLLTELGVTLPAAPTVYCDNIGATYLCANPVFHSRMNILPSTIILFVARYRLMLYVLLMFLHMTSLPMDWRNHYHVHNFKQYETRLASPRSRHLERAC